MAIQIKNSRIDFRQAQKAGIQLLHGGAGPADPKNEQYLKACHEIQQISKLCLDLNLIKKEPVLYPLLAEMNEAEQRVLSAAIQLENHPIFNAGLGASLQEDGRARVSASFMESTRQKFSAVINLEHIKNPSQLAYYLQQEKFSVLDHRGGEKLAQKLGMPLQNLVTEERMKTWLDFRAQNGTGRTGTIGSVCLSGDGHLAALTSTGGVGNETIGRIGDSPTIAGNYCDQQTAISCTGYGEQIVALGLSVKIATRVQDGLSLIDAVQTTFKEAETRNFQFALIAIHYDKSTQSGEWLAASVNSQLLWCLV